MEITEIKQQLTLATLLHHYGLKPDKSLRLNCPFHNDKTPSLQVYYKTHTVYCFSANCKTHGKPLDVIDFVMHKENCSKHEAILKCKQLVGGEPLPAVTLPGLRTAILGNMFTYFKNAVSNSDPAKTYIRERGLNYETLEIGYNSGQFHHGARKDEGLINDCLQVGLLSVHDKLGRTGETSYRVFGKGCIVFALRNKQHQVSGLYFRSTYNDADQKHFYLKDRKGLYPGYPAASTEKLILTEAIIDASTLLQQPAITRDYSVLACYGTNGLLAEHMSAIKTLSHLKEIIFAFDADEAGNKAVEKYAALLKEQLPAIILTHLELPTGEDINSISLSHEPQIFVHLFTNRKSIFSSVEEKTPEPVITVKATPVLNTSHPHKLIYDTDQLQYCIQGGLSKLLDSMKVTLVVERKANGQKSRNKVDLYEDKQVEKLSRDISERLGVDRFLLDADLSTLTDLLDSYREKDQQQNDPASAKVYPMTAAERSGAEQFLKQADLIGQLNELLGSAGIVGEETNRIFLLLIAISYKMPETLHALIQGSSGSGKTRLLKQISDCIPPENVTKLTRVSDKVLYNYPEHYFVNRLLCLEDIDGLSEEAEFAFRELQSNGELNSATSIKLENGTITSGQKTVKGPIASLACTTRGEIYEDNMSRVFLLAVDESSDQTNRIINYQNTKATGNIDGKQEQETKQFIQHLVRCLQPLEVVNPYACKLQLPPDAHKIRRLNDLFLNFVKMVTLLHQYQRMRDSKGRLITEISDLEVAVDIMFESIVLKVDELDGSLRQFYEQLKKYLERQPSTVLFTQREVRQALRISKAQCSRYFTQLLQLEYIVCQNGNNLRKVQYKIDYWDQHKMIRERISSDLATQISQLRQSGTIQ